MSLYTVILDYRGGTYIGQVEASSPARAVATWCNRRGKINGITAQTKTKLRELLEKDTPVVVKSCKNVWCVSAMLGRNLALVHAVKTSTARK